MQPLYGGFFFKENAMKKQAFDAIIFDLDGTLWDSAENVARSWNAAIKQQRFTKSDIMNVMGLTMDEIAARFFPDKSEKERRDIIAVCCRYENEYLRTHGGVIFRNTKSTLRALSKKYPLYIVSNCQQGYIEAFLEYYKLDKVIKGALCWGDTKLPKADNISLLMKTNRLKKALYVGDTQGDCNSAYKAGAKFAFAEYGFGKADRYDYRLQDISQLTHCLAPVRKSKAIEAIGDVFEVIVDIADFIFDIQ